MRLTQRLLKCKKGAALVEYSLLVAGVALIGAASVSTFGHKTNDMIAMAAAVLPGAHADDNAPIMSGKIIETKSTAGPGGTAGSGIGLDIDTIVANSNTDRLDANIGDGLTASTLILEP
jgi:Flp pilus assembly pilin Flp